MRSYALLLVVLLPAIGLGQRPSYFDKGKTHYENNEYREALYCFNRFVKADTTRAELYKMRGNCFYELNLLDSAEADYKHVLRLSGDFPEVYYNLSNLFAVKNDFPTAESYSRKFLRIRPNDGEGLYQLSTILKRIRPDSSFYYLEKAWTTDTLNQYVYNSMAWELFERGDPAKARRMARQSRKHFVYTNELLPLEAYASFALGDFRETIAIADSLIRRHSEDLTWYVLQCKAEILANTPRDKYTQRGFNFRLNEYSADMETLDRWVNDPQHPYHYGTLKDKFISKLNEMSFADFLMVYYGYTTDKDYSPYAPGVGDVLGKITEDTSDEEKLKIYRSVLEQNPFHIRTYESLAMLAFSMKKMDVSKDALKRYLGLMESIMASGTGQSADSAYFVVCTTDEYNLLNYVGLRAGMQSLTNIGGHSYDVLSARDEKGQEHDVYFLIDKPFGSLSKTFRDSGKSSSAAGKKSQKKKKRRNKD